MNFILQFVNLSYHTDLQILTHSYIPGINPTWSFYCIAEFGLLIFCRGFIHRCSSGILVYNFIFLCVWCHCLVLVSGWSWPYKMSFEAFLPLQFFFFFWNSLRKIHVNYRNVWWDSPEKAPESGLLFVGIFKITDSIKLLVIGLFIFYISSWFSPGKLEVFRNLSTSSRLSILLVYNCSK